MRKRLLDQLAAAQAEDIATLRRDIDDIDEMMNALETKRAEYVTAMNGMFGVLLKDNIEKRAVLLARLEELTGEKKESN